jgi:hypothetical protein
VKLGSFSFDPFIMLVVNMMHEFELGIWKAIFTHLIQLLYAAAPGGSIITKLDRRCIICGSNVIINSEQLLGSGLFLLLARAPFANFATIHRK